MHVKDITILNFVDSHRDTGMIDYYDYTPPNMTPVCIVFIVESGVSNHRLEYALNDLLRFYSTYYFLYIYILDHNKEVANKVRDYLDECNMVYSSINEDEVTNKLRVCMDAILISSDLKVLEKNPYTDYYKTRKDNGNRFQLVLI